MAERTARQEAYTEFIRPNRGWFLGAAGVIAVWLLYKVDAPAWLGVLTLVLLLLAAIFWPWFEKRRSRKIGFVAGSVIYATFAATLILMAPRAIFETDARSPDAAPGGFAITSVIPPGKQSPVEFLSALFDLHRRGGVLLRDADTSQAAVYDRAVNEWAREVHAALSRNQRVADAQLMGSDIDTPTYQMPASVIPANRQSYHAVRFRMYRLEGLLPQVQEQLGPDVIWLPPPKQP